MGMKGVGIGLFVVGIIILIIVFVTVLSFPQLSQTASGLPCEENVIQGVNEIVSKMAIAPNTQPPFQDKLLLPKACVLYLATGSTDNGVEFIGKDANGKARALQTFSLPASVGGQSVLFVNGKTSGENVQPRDSSYDVTVDPKKRTITVEVQ